MSLRFVLVLALCAAAVPAAAQNDPALSQLSLEQLGRIEVTSTSKEPEEIWRTPAAVFVLTRSDISRSGATSIPEALRMVPGVEVARIDSDTWSIGVRGFGSRLSKSVLILIDGRSVYTPLFGGVYWEEQDTLLDDVDRIEVIRGPGGTVWGANAVNGVINIITRGAKETHGVLATAGGGNVDQGNGAVRYGGGNGKGLDYRVYGKAFTRGPEFHPDNRNFDDWRMGQGGFRVDWDSGRRDSVTVQGDLYKGVTGQRSTISGYTPPLLVNAEGNVGVSGGNVLARWRRAFADGSDVQVQSYYNYTHRLELGFGEDRSTFDVDFIHHLKPVARQDIIWGLGANVASSDTIQTVPTVIFVPPQQVDRFVSAFAQDQITLVPNRLFVTVGSKVLDNNYTGAALEPSARLLWTPAGSQSVWVSATRAVRTPSDIEENVQLTQSIVPGVYLRLEGNGSFINEKLNGYEAGYRGLFGPNVSMDVAVFYNNYNDVFSAELKALAPEATPAPLHLVLPLLFGNGLLGNTSGFELSSAWTPVSQWRVNGSYSFLHMDMAAKATSTDATSAAMDNGSSPRHQVAVHSALNLPKRLEFDQTYRYVSALSALTIDAYHTADLRASWRANDSLELALVGQNLLQPHHVEFNGDPGTLVGILRSVYVKATWRR